MHGWGSTNPFGVHGGPGSTADPGTRRFFPARSRGRLGAAGRPVERAPFRGLVSELRRPSVRCNGGGRLRSLRRSATRGVFHPRGFSPRAGWTILGGSTFREGGDSRKPSGMTHGSTVALRREPSPAGHRSASDAAESSTVVPRNPECSIFPGDAKCLRAPSVSSTRNMDPSERVGAGCMRRHKLLGIPHEAGLSTQEACSGLWSRVAFLRLPCSMRKPRPTPRNASVQNPGGCAIQRSRCPAPESVCP